jgi:hypothetical protein
MEGSPLALRLIAHSRLPRSRAAIGLVVLAVLVAAGGEAGAASSSGTTHAKAVATAKKGLLKKSDFPKGWTTSGSSSSGGGPNPFGAVDESSFASCIGVPESVLNLNVPSASSPEFDQNNQALTVNDSVQVFPDQSGAATDVGITSNPKTVPCFNQQLASDPTFAQTVASGIGKGATVGAVSVSALPQLPYGQDSAGIELAIPITYQGLTGTLDIDMITIAKGRSEGDLLFTSLGGFPTSLGTHLEKVTAQRLVA